MHLKVCATFHVLTILGQLKSEIKLCRDVHHMGAKILISKEEHHTVSCELHHWIPEQLSEECTGGYPD
ncbi:hypothetical protein NPIL_590371 [Nephila pilipes]|uniref:Uncharacterized protein n=1 Tax=Nephila pilipes TaxID=299642 RepID=A0A8X6NR29_NEPPI|nr:hypothetical protein NPIL_590371 [Nephila pilipes]